MSQYYEAVLQLRNAGNETLGFIRSEIRAKNVNITKTVRHKNGIDIYLSSKSFALSLGKKLVSKFGGSFKSSAKLVGKKNDKNLYRVAVYYEASEYQEGDIVEIDGKVVKIKKVARFISGTDLMTGKNIKIDAKGKTIKKLRKYKTTISKYRPALEVIHPETYQSVPVLNQIETKKTNVVVVLTKKGVYLSFS